MRVFQTASLLVAIGAIVASPRLLVADEAKPTTARNTAPPNIVFFLVDDLGWADVGCYGSTFYETPNIDSLAKQGVRFTDAYAACHVCSPTRASIMTGKYPARLGLTDWLAGRREFNFQHFESAKRAPHLTLDEVTIAEALKAHGYATGHFGKWHLGEEPNGPTAQGFDVQVPRWNKGWPRAGYLAPFKLNGIADQPGQYLTDRLTDEALKFVDRNKDKPFFLYLSHFAVHDPIEGRLDLVEKYKKKLAKLKLKTGKAFILEGNPDDKQPLSRDTLDVLINRSSHKGHRVLPQRTVKIKQHQDNVQFAAMIEAMDESLRRVMAKLDALNLADNTIIVFYSDNGGMSGANFGNPKRIVNPSSLDRAYATSNLPLRGAKGWLYEGGVRVPMIVRWPGGGKKGIVCREPIISPDFFPSLLEMAELPAMPSQHVDGKSFVPAVQGKPFVRGPIYWHFPHYSNHGMQSPGGAVRVGDYKLLDYFENGTVQLFDLKNDLGEQNNLAQSNPKKTAELLVKLKAWRKSVSANMPLPK